MMDKGDLQTPASVKAAESDKAGVRGADRDKLLLKSPIRLLAVGVQIEARIRNLSAGGLMAEAPVRVANGDPVEVELRNIGWVPGKVAWSAEGRFGVAFDHPINPLIARNPVSSGRDDVPQYLQNLNKPPYPVKRRV